MDINDDLQEIVPECCAISMPDSEDGYQEMQFPTPFNVFLLHISNQDRLFSSRRWSSVYTWPTCRIFIESSFYLFIHSFSTLFKSTCVWF